MSVNAPIFIHSAAMLLKMNPLVIDTETTALGEEAEVVEVAICDIWGNVIFQSLSRPTGNCDPEAMAVNKITPEMLANAPEWADIMGAVYKIINRRAITGWHVEFDARMLRQSCAKAGHESYQRHIQFIDMKAPYEVFNGRISERTGKLALVSLSKAAEQQGITVPENAHRAAADVQMTAAIIRKMAGLDGGLIETPKDDNPPECLRPYLIGENDLVIAYNEQQALDVFSAYVGDACCEDLTLDDVSDMSGIRYRPIYNEDGSFDGSIYDLYKDLTEPEYLLGWE